MHDIIVISDPKITLDNISIRDTEYGTDTKYVPIGTETKFSKFLGDFQPVIQINNLLFQDADLPIVILDCSSFLPKLTLSVKSKGGLFTSRAFPKDGDVVSLYIKSNNKDYKPIRADFKVISVSSSPSYDDKGEIADFGLECILDIPKINIDRIKCFSNKSSIDVLKDITDDLKIGLAINESGVIDSMNWIIPNTSYYDFLINDLLLHCYKDDNSFFTSFIDYNYHLNFVEINKILNGNDDINMGIVEYLSSTDHMPDDKEKTRDKIPFVFSNSKKVNNTPFKISGYTLISDSGYISFLHGYRNFIMYYDKDQKSFEQYFIETITSDNAADKIILKERDNIDHTQFVKSTLLPALHNDNVNKNYHYAKVHNDLNNKEMRKINLCINLEGINLNIYRYQKIPVYVVTGDTNEYRKKLDYDSLENLSIDKFISGQWIVMDVFHIHDRFTKQYYTKVILTRREFDKPNGVV